MDIIMNIQISKDKAKTKLKRIYCRAFHFQNWELSRISSRVSCCTKCGFTHDLEHFLGEEK